MLNCNRLTAIATWCAVTTLLIVGGIEPARALEFVPEQVVVEVFPGVDIEGVNARWGTSTIASFEDDLLHLLDTNGQAVVPLALQMIGDPEIQDAEPNVLKDTPEGVRHMVVTAIGGDLVDFEDQGLVDRISLEAAHAYTRGLGMVVGVLDTGIDPDHELFQGRLLPGYDFVDEDFEPWEEANGIDDDQDAQTDDGFGHGSMVAGIVLLVAPDAMILPLRVLDDEGRSDAYRIARALRYATEAGVDVVNLSFGSPDGVSFLQTELERLELSDALIVSGAGNENREEPAYFPAESSKCIMIAALDSMDVKADFSDWNQDVFLSAPGTGVRSAFPGGGWALGSGCSFATPLVSGMGALVRAMRPTWNKEFVEDHLEDVAFDGIYHIPANQPYEDELGSGRINVRKAVQGLDAASVPAPSSNSRFEAWPNPSRAEVWFRVESMSITSVDVIDASGRFVSRIEGLTEGIGSWDALDSNGRPAPSGIYYFRGPGQERLGRVTILR